MSDREAREWGFQLSSASDLSGIVFPYHDPETGQRVTVRLRRNHPDTDTTGKAERKYLCPYGDTRHLYFPPGAGALLADMAVPLVFVEAEKSALTLTALAARAGEKLLLVGTGGCWGWRGKVGIATGPRGDRREARGPLPDLDRIHCSGRDTIILFDANVSTNPRVRAARRAFAEELQARGASVKITNLPQLDGVNGPDDLIATSGDEAMWALFDSARPVAETAEAEAEAVVTALEAKKTQDPTTTLKSVAAVADPLRRTLFAGRIAALRIPGLTKSVIEKSLETERRTTEEKGAEAMETARRERLLRLQLNPAKLIADLEAYYSRRRHFPADAAFVEALFCLNTYTFDVFDTTPYLLYESATGGCGKTTALEFHEMVCAQAYLGVDPSPAALYRRIERDRPTWLLDEAAILQAHGERARELLALFDAGYKSGATVARCEEHGDTLREFRVFCPKVLSRVGGFRGTLLDRGIVIHLEKAHGLAQTRRRVLMREAAPLKETLQAYALQCRAELQQLYENEPDEGYWPEFSGREAQIWGPLLTHARLAGPNIEARAMAVALQFSRRKAEIAITEDRNLALAQEALEVLGALEGETFCPRDLLKPLLEKETWGPHLADRKSEKAQVSAVGQFFRQFRFSSRKHTATGTQYNRLEAMEVLGRHTPDFSPSAQLPEGGVNVSGTKTTALESTGSANDTSQNKVSVEVSGTQATENKEAAIRADTLTPISMGTAGDEEDVL